MLLCFSVVMLCTHILHHVQLPACSVLIDCGATVDQPAENCITPLHLAAYVGNKEAVSLLLRKGATVGLKDSHVSAGWRQCLEIMHVLYSCKRPSLLPHTAYVSCLLT